MTLPVVHGVCLLIQLLALGLKIQTADGLEQSQVNAAVNEDCTRYCNGTSQYRALKYIAIKLLHYIHD